MDHKSPLEPHRTSTNTLPRYVFLALSLVSFSVLASDEESLVDIEYARVIANLELKAVTSACHAELNQQCSKAKDGIACLRSLHNLPQSNSLGACCSAKLHETGSASEQQDIGYFSGVRIPQGSELRFDYSCETATIVTTDTTQYKTMNLAAGPLVFGGLGNLKLARLAGQQTVHDLMLDDGESFTQLYNNGVPKNVRLHSTSEQHGIKFKAIENINDVDQYSWSDLPTDLLYQLAIDPYVVIDENTTKLHKDGRVARGNIAEAVVINGLPMAPGITEFNGIGEVVSGKLSRNYQYNDLLLGAGNIRFYENGYIGDAILAEGATLNRFQIDSASRIVFDYKSGKPRKLKLGIDGYSHKSIMLGPFLQSTGRSLDLYQNGQVKELRTDNHSWYEGKMYPPDTTIKFNQQGDIEWDSFYDEFLLHASLNSRLKMRIPEIIPAAEVRGGLLIPKGSLVYPSSRSGDTRVVVPYPFEYRGFRISAGEFLLDREFNIRIASLEKDTSHYGALLKSYPFKIFLSLTGKITEATLSNDTELNGIEFTKNHRIEFSADGQVLSGLPKKSPTIDNRVYQANKRLLLNRQGAVVQGVLEESSKIGSTVVPANSTLSFFTAKLIKIDSADTILVGTTEHSGSKLILYPDGTIQQGILANNAMINGELEMAGTTLGFDANGKLRHKFANTSNGFPSLQSADPITVMGQEVVESIAPMSLQQCQQLIAEAKQTRGVWLTNTNAGFATFNRNFFKDCVDRIVAESIGSTD